MAAAEHRFRVMASTAQVVVVDGDPDLGVEAEAHLRRLESRWSRFLPDSDITRLNRAGGRPVAVAADTLVLVTAMVEAWRLTGGRFDPTTLPALVAAGYEASIDDPTRVTRLPAGAALDGDPGAIEVDPVASTVTLPVGLVVDPGGIGKGLAADLTVEHLRGRGAGGALVSVGGDLAVAGAAPEPSGWPIVVEDPLDASSEVCALAVDRGGVATSSTVSRTWTHDGRTRHHLIDPDTGLPSTSDLAAVTVVAPTCWRAEALATATLLRGAVDAVAYLEGQGVDGIAVGHDGAIRSTLSLTPSTAGAPR